MKHEVGSYEAKTRLAELLRQVESGESFVITNRGRAIADLVPHEDDRSLRKNEAVQRLQHFIRSGRRIKGPRVRQLIEEGRD